jgi:hypothetical protein
LEPEGPEGPTEPLEPSRPSEPSRPERLSEQEKRKGEAMKIARRRVKLNLDMIEPPF